MNEFKPGLAGVIAFEKFATSPAVQFQRTIRTGAYWPVKIQLTKTQLRKVEPLTYQLVKLSGHVKYTYEHAKFATLQPFTDAWKNYWPAYVQGSIGTSTFLRDIAKAAKPS